MTQNEKREVRVERLRAFLTRWLSDSSCDSNNDNNNDNDIDKIIGCSYSHISKNTRRLRKARASKKEATSPLILLYSLKNQPLLPVAQRPTTNGRFAPWWLRAYVIKWRSDLPTHTLTITTVTATPTTTTATMAPVDSSTTAVTRGAYT